MAQLLPKKICTRQKIALSTSEFTFLDQARPCFLHRLQKNRWKYCCQCQSFHPHSMRRGLESKWRLTQQPCGFDCRMGGTSVLRKDLYFAKPLKAGSKVKCSPAYAGEVDICPCDGMKFHQKQHFDQSCQVPLTGERQFHQSELDYRFTYLDLSHQYTFVNPYGRKVFTRTKIWLNSTT